MKSLKLKVTLVLIFYYCIGNTQVINWKNINQNNLLNAGLGLEYGSIYNIGYAHQINIGKLPLLLNAEISIPFGKKKFDDYKTKIGGIIRVIKINNINVGVKVQGIFRVYNNDFVRILNFGSDFSTTIGYYKPKWFVAAEAGFDKAIVSHFKHTDLYLSNFPDVVDGWYEPSTGGNFYYGLQTGYSFKKQDITLKIGKLITQDFDTTPMIPFYLQLGCNYKFGKIK
ncbi:hypothetical protein [Flavobacterium sp. U410]